MTTSKEAEFDYSEARKAFEKDEGYGGELDLDWDASRDGYLLGETQHIYQIYRDGYKAGALSKEPTPSQLPEEVAKLITRLLTLGREIHDDIRIDDAVAMLQSLAAELQYMKDLYMQTVDRLKQTRAQLTAERDALQRLIGGQEGSKDVQQ